jgi:hypothetical protein
MRHANLPRCPVGEGEGDTNQHSTPHHTAHGLQRQHQPHVTTMGQASASHTTRCSTTPALHCRHTLNESQVLRHGNSKLAHSRLVLRLVRSREGGDEVEGQAIEQL